MDFKSWQASLGVQLTGQVNTNWEKHANHVWRFVKRGDIGGYNGSDQWDIKPGCVEWKDLEPHPDDVIGLYKESMHSTVLSPRPIVVLPHCIASGKLVDKGPHSC